MTITIQKERKNSCLVLFLIASCFCLTGSGYLSWLYNLMAEAADSTLSNSGLLGAVFTNVDLLTEVIGYFFQVVGLLISVILINKQFNKVKFSLIIVIDLVFIILSMMMSDYSLILIMGYLMNTIHGIVSGYYLTCLIRMVPSNRIGVVFGTGYAIGTIGTWIISLFNGGEFLKQPAVIYIYLVLTAICIMIIHGLFPMSEVRLADVNETINQSNAYYGFNNIIHNNINLIIISGLAVMFLSFVKGVGFYFPMADISGGNFSLEFVRIFYAVGLIIAGIVNDFDYRWGRVLCVSGLVLPFVLITLGQNQIGSIYLWIISYSFTGFYTVYRIVVMARYGYYQFDRKKVCIPIIIFGLILGRIGDLIGSLAGIVLSDKPVILIMTGAIMYAVTIFVIFAEMRTNNTNNLQHKTENLKDESIHKMNETENVYLNIKREYQISDREYEVFILLLKGYTNSRIASELFISENTVKFHVKNILKKVGCNNRKELSSMINNT